MAPRRKRTTGKKWRTARTKPQLPEGKLDSSMTLEEKENKLEDYILDYEIQVKTKLEKLKKWELAVNNLIANIYRNALICIPKSVRQLTMKEFLAKGGTVNTAINAQMTENVQDFVSSSMPLFSSSNDRLPVTSMSSQANMTASIISETSQAESKVKTGRKKVRIADETPAQPTTKTQRLPTATRSSRRLQAKSSTQGVTPCASGQSVVQTPFITPKFDPRLPITPAIMREPKAGERIVSMCGSPLTNPVVPNAGNDAQVFIPLKGGKTIQLSSHDPAMSLNELNVANDNIALRNIKLLQDKLSMLLLQMPKKT